MIKQLSSRLTNNLMLEHSPMNLVLHTLHLSYGYLKLGSRVKIDNYLVKTMTYSQYKNKWFMNLNIQLRLSTIILIY